VKSQNRIFYVDSQEEAHRLRDEYEYLGYYVTVDQGWKVTVHAVTPKSVKPKRERREGRRKEAIDSATHA
jgi:hypothetical protein